MNIDSKYNQLNRSLASRFYPIIMTKFQNEMLLFFVLIEGITFATADKILWALESEMGFEQYKKHEPRF